MNEDFGFLPTPVYQFDSKTEELIKVWPSIRQASKHFNVNISNISNCIHGRQMTSCGFIWGTSDKCPKFLRNKEKKLHLSRKRNPVIQFDIETKEEISRFSSLWEAYQKTGINASQILKCCVRETPYAGDYLWIYEKDFTEEDLENLLEIAKKKKDINKIRYSYAKKQMYSGKSVLQINPQTGVIIRIWNNAREAEEELKGRKTGDIYKALSGKRALVYGYRWKYLEDNKEKERLG